MARSREERDLGLREGTPPHVVLAYLWVETLSSDYGDLQSVERQIDRQSSDVRRRTLGLIEANQRREPWAREEIARWREPRRPAQQSPELQAWFADVRRSAEELRTGRTGRHLAKASARKRRRGR